MQTFEEQLDQAVERLKKEVSGLAAVYLFGSAAAGTEHVESDVDLAILKEEGQVLDPETRWRLSGDLADVFRGPVDLVDLRRASLGMRVQVVDTGRVLFEADETERRRFEMTTLSMYADLNETRRPLLADIHNRGSVYG